MDKAKKMLVRVVVFEVIALSIIVFGLWWVLR